MPLCFSATDTLTLIMEFIYYTISSLKLYIHNRYGERRKKLWVNSGRTFSNVLEHQWIFVVHAFLESLPWVPDWLIGVVGWSFFLWTHRTLYGSHTWPHNLLIYQQLWAMLLKETSPSARWRCGPLRLSVCTDISVSAHGQPDYCGQPGEQRAQSRSGSVYTTTLGKMLRQINHEMFIKYPH